MVARDDSGAVVGGANLIVIQHPSGAAHAVGHTVNDGQRGLHVGPVEQRRAHARPVGQARHLVDAGVLAVKPVLFGREPKRIATIGLIQIWLAFVPFKIDGEDASAPVAVHVAVAIALVVALAMTYRYFIPANRRGGDATSWRTHGDDAGAVTSSR
jgi:hypothetical protein